MKKKIISVLIVMIFVILCVTLSACAKEETKYNIAIDTLQNGTVMASQATASAGETITLSVTPAGGFELKAESLKQNGTALTVTDNSATFIMPDADVMITATFESVSVATTYTITFNLNGGTHSNADTLSQIIKQGETAAAPTNSTNVGKEFNGWWISDDDGITLQSEYNFSTIVSANITLYADWVDETSVVGQLPAPQIFVLESSIFWKIILHSKGYNVVINETTAPFDEISNSEVNDTKFDLSNLQAGIYKIKVMAKGNGYTSVNSAYSSNTISVKVLANPSNIKVDYNDFYLSWETVKYAERYYISYATKKSGEYTDLEATRDTNIVLPELMEAQTYYIKIVAETYNYISGETVWEFNNLKIRSPYNLSVDNNGMLSWSSVIGANKYEILANKVSHFATTNTNALQLTNGDQTIQVRAIDTNADKLTSKWSEVKFLEIVFDKQGGTGGSDSVMTSINSTMPLAKKPTKEGYIFVGYFDAISGGTQYYSSTMTSLKLLDTKMTTLFAHWIEGTEGLSFLLVGDEYSVSKGTATKATNIVIPSAYNGKPVTSIASSAFSGCSSLTSVTIPNSVTSIGYRAFFGCSSLTSIAIPDSVTSLGSYAFAGCSSLTSITVAEGNKKYHSEGNSIIDTATKTLILGCKDSIIPTDGSVTSIGSSAFSYCSSLTSIYIPESVTSIGGSAFSYCSSLTSITIGNSVTSMGDQAFYDCTSLTSIDIPNSVTIIGDWTFAGCSSLTNIIYSGTTAQWEAITKDVEWDYSTGNYTVTCNNGTLLKSQS